MSAKHRKRLGPIKSPKIDQIAVEMFEAIESGALPSSAGSPYKPSTIRSYRRSYKTEILPVLGSVKIDGLTRKHIQHLVDDLAKRQSPNSVRNILMPLRLLVRYASQRDLVQSDPFQAVQLPGKDESPVRVLSINEAKTVISALEGYDRAIFATALLSGLRLGELRALRWRNVDFDNEVIQVEWSWDRSEGWIRPKSRAGLRNVPLMPELVSILRELRSDDPDGFVLSATERPFNPQSLYTRIDRVLKPLGLGKCRLHGCRHFFGSMLISSGATIKEVQTYMGHSTVQTTIDRYTHLLGGDEARTASRFSAHLSSEGFSSPEPIQLEPIGT